MSSILATAVTAMVAALSAGTPVAPTIGRVRLRPIQEGVDLAVNVKPLDAEPGDSAITPGLPIWWVGRIAVECYARAAAGEAPDVAVDQLVTDVYERLCADLTLGGAINLLQPMGISYEYDAAGDQSVCATQIFAVRILAAANLFTP